tara:strand:+ start:3114 stop:4985 length:1872 start_codon:yes stop_codon:yes gene_type:complete
MALESGGLDAQIEQRMDAYRGNPQKLQQRYGANKELLDLLALQKLTSEKKAVAADMQMKMQQQPGTIAQQREQEALQLTKQEMGGTLGELAGRTKGTLDQKQRMQQQNMQRMAKAQPRKPAGIAGLPGLGGGAQPRRPQAAPPQAQGLAAARMAQGPKMMAGGGIVSFVEGKGVSGQSGLDGAQTLEQKIARIMARSELTALQKDSLIRQIKAQEPKPEAKRPESMSPVGRVSSARMPGVRGMIPTSEATNALDVFAATNPSIAPKKKDDLGITAALPDGGLEVAAALTDDDMGLPQGPLPNQAQPSVPKPDEGGLPSLTVPQTGGAVNPVGPAMSPTNETSADAALQKGMNISDEYLKRDETSAKYDEMLGRMQAFDKENYSPDEDLTAFLIGTGGTGSIGAAARGGYAAMSETRNNRRKRLFDEFNMERAKMGDDSVLGRAGLQLANQMAADANANERTAIQSATTLTAEQMRQVGKDADRILDAQKAEMDNTTKLAQVEVQKVQNDRLADQTRLTAAYKVQGDIAAQRDTAIQTARDNSALLQDLNIQRAEAMEDNDVEKLAKIDQNIAAEDARITLIVNTALNKSGLLELEEIARTIAQDLILKGSGRSVEDLQNVSVD